MKSVFTSKMKLSKSLSLLFFVMILVTQIPMMAQINQTQYNLSQPVETQILPAVLNEISGITLQNTQTMICVQDELGEIFFYHLGQKKIGKHFAFAKDGDFEDVALAGNEAWVLKSNGKLYCIKSFEDASKMKMQEFNTPLTKENNCEGLCYDPVENVLLIACKGIPATKNYYVGEGKRAVYKFDLKTKTFIQKPAYLIDLIKITEFLTKLNPGAGNKISIQQKKKDVVFEPSAIAVHPTTKEIWVMASTGKSIIVLNRKGEILAVEHLDKNVFPQPEGMAFAPDGTLYISSEGDGDSGKLMKFEMVK